MATFATSRTSMGPEARAEAIAKAMAIRWSPWVVIRAPPATAGLARTEPITVTVLGPGLFNAIRRGIPLRIVTDRARAVPGTRFNCLMVRKSLVDSGRIKALAVTSAARGDR